MYFPTFVTRWNISQLYDEELPTFGLLVFIPPPSSKVNGPKKHSCASLAHSSSSHRADYLVPPPSAAAVVKAVALVSGTSRSSSHARSPLVFISSPHCGVTATVEFCGMVPLFVETLSKWFAQQAKKYTSGTPFTVGDKEEQMQKLAYEVIERNWDSLVEAVSLSEKSAADVENFLQSTLHICVNVLAHCRDAPMIRERLHIIALVLKNCLAIDKPVLRRVLENMAEQTIAVVFWIIDSELIMMQTSVIAEVLHLFAKSYPSQTRAVIASLPGGDSQGVAEMFAQVTVENFQLRVSQMHTNAMMGLGWWRWGEWINEK